MRKYVQFFVLSCFVLSAASDEKVETSTRTVNLSQKSRSRSGRGSEENANGNWTSLSDILDVFSARNLVNKWIEGKYPVGAQCDQDIARYVEGLRKEEPWALKVDDASGRYNNGFFWGNSYFTGSSTECAYIGKDYIRQNIKRANATDTSMDFILDTAPYTVGFYVIKAAINSSLSPTTKLLHFGVCLPFSCTAADVAVIAKVAASDVAAMYSNIENVRDQHDQYDMYEDPVYWILCGVSAAILLVMVAGTVYDIYLSRRITRKKNIIYDLEKQAKLEQLTVNETPKPPLNVTDIGVNGSSTVNNNNDHEATAYPTHTPQLHKLSISEELLLSFSVSTNLKTICDGNVGGDTISTVHGLRALSMAWIILGHTCIVLFKYSDNMEYRKVFEKKILFQTISNAPFSVDTFFFMGGLLVSFLYFRTNAKGDLNKLTQGTRGFVAASLKFIGLLLYRFCRLTTPYMFVLGVTEITMKWFHYNSVFESPTADHYNCPNYWWRNLLYINTLFPVDQMCMLWSWYVADDTQFYTVGAVILILATNHFKIAAFALVILLVSSWLTTGYIALVNNHMPHTDDPFALFDKIYDKPWTRLGPYLIGMAVGYFLFKTDCKIKMSKTTVTVGWLFSSACLLSLLYGLYEAELAPITAAAYSSLSHSAWALGLAWIVVACSTGYGGYVNRILSAPILYPFSRVTYCVYLIHPIIIRVTVMNQDSPFHLGKETVMITFIGQLVMSYVLSFVVSLTFEAPVVSMLKILAPKKRKRIE